MDEADSIIKFRCENCGQKINVKDKYVGKQGKCPNCGHGIVVPYKSTIFEFLCENCGRTISVPKINAGKKSKCPNCKNIFVVPEAEDTGPAASQNISAEPKTGGKYSAYDLTLLNISEKEKIQHLQTHVSEETGENEQELEGESAEEPETAGRRKFPWFIDIFLYPFSKPGLKNLVIFIGVPLLIDILGTILPIQLSCLFGLVVLVVNVLIFFYIYWYFAECVRDSAEGGQRAPEGLGATPGFMGMFWQTVNIIGCLALFFGPFVFYMLFARRADIIFWLLLSFAVFFYPMGLLAVVMFDSAVGLNPRLLINSISSTFFPYFGLVLLFMTPVVLIGIIQPEMQESLFWKFMLRSVIVYGILVAAHILGRFYWRYQDKLNWAAKLAK